jgi:hypothetical protein
MSATNDTISLIELPACSGEANNMIPTFTHTFTFTAPEFHSHEITNNTKAKTTTDIEAKKTTQSFIH